MATSPEQDVIDFLTTSKFRPVEGSEDRWQTPEHWRRQQEGTLTIADGFARIVTDDGFTIFHVALSQPTGTTET